MNGSTHPWPAELDAAVRELYPTMTAVKLAAELSEKFGVAVTRCAVSAKQTGSA